MGYGYAYICKKCKKCYSIYLGIGMAFPIVYQEIVANIKFGNYGDEWRKFFNSVPYTVVDAEGYLYKCETCGNWEVAPSLDIYAPKNSYNEKTIEELNNIPFVSKYKLKYDYHLFKRYIHKCSKCGTEMRKITDDSDFMNLNCPKCHTLNEPNGFFNWD